MLPEIALLSLALAQPVEPLRVDDLVVHSRPDATWLQEALGEAATQSDATADVVCTVTLRGELSECSVVAAAPDEELWTEVALEYVQRLRVHSSTRDYQRAAGRQVILPIRLAAGGLEPRPAEALLSERDLRIVRYGVRESFSLDQPRHSSLTVIVRCVVQAGGIISDCRIERDDAPDQNFGQRAMAFVEGIVISETSLGGEPTTGRTLRYRVVSVRD